MLRRLMVLARVQWGGPLVDTAPTPVTLSPRRSGDRNGRTAQRMLTTLFSAPDLLLIPNSRVIRGTRAMGVGFLHFNDDTLLNGPIAVGIIH